jgi:Glycosyl transferase family 2
VYGSAAAKALPLIQGARQRMEDAMNSLAALDISPVTPGQASGAVGQNPLVSIIIPCFNGEAYLRETLESALAQTYPCVEIIVVDDGSTDRSGGIAQEYPIRYIHQSNRGLTPSRNLGIQESRGSYIVFLDADDRLKPEAIEIGLRVLAQHPECAITVGDHLFVSADGSYLGPSKKKCLPGAHYEALLQSNFIEMISSVLFRKSVFDAVGIFDVNLRVAEDYELYLRIAREHAIWCHPTVVAEYRLHKTNASRNSELMLTMTLDVLKTQRLHVSGHPTRESAYAAGKARWRRQYGRQLASELARSSSTMRMEPLRRKIAVLLRYYPQGFGMLVLLKLVPDLVQRHNRRAVRRNSEGERPNGPLVETLQARAKPGEAALQAPIG